MLIHELATGLWIMNLKLYYYLLYSHSLKKRIEVLRELRKRSETLF